MNKLKANKTEMELKRCSGKKCSNVVVQTVSVADSHQALINFSKMEDKLTLVVCGFLGLFDSAFLM